MASKEIVRDIDKLGNELVTCRLNCEGVNNNPKEGIIPRCLYLEERPGKNKCVVVGLNPGKCRTNQKQFYLSNGFSYESEKKLFFETKLFAGKALKEVPYFKKTRDLLSIIEYNGDILWTDLVKCECSEKNGVLTVQTLRVCINKFLRREIESFDAKVIFALGNKAFDFCALSFPNHFVVGLPHPTGSYGNFHNFRKRLLENPKQYIDKLSRQKDQNGNCIAVHFSA